MEKKIRLNAIEVTITHDLMVTYRLTLPIKEQHRHLFDDHERIKSYIKRDKIRYYYEYISDNRVDMLAVQKSAQLIILDGKVNEMRTRKTILLTELSELQIP